MSKEFKEEVNERIEGNKDNYPLKKIANEFMLASTKPKYSYNFSWMGRPIIQYPQDMIAMQEIVWEVKPDLIIETGIAHGGSLIFTASMLELLSICEGDSEGIKRMVLGIDIDIREKNRIAIEKHPMSNRIQMIQGSSIDCEIVEEVKQIASKFNKVLVCLDSNHTEDHVLKELQAYSGLVTPESYCVVFDTIIEDFPEDTYPDRSWGPGNSPKSAVKKFLEANNNFIVDETIDSKLLLSVAPSGYLKRRL